MACSFVLTPRKAALWVITDSRRVNAQARRLDGEPWERKNSKAWTLPGSVGTWPIGLREARDFPAILLTEGGPDLLAAFHFVWVTAREEIIAPVAVLGASMSIAEAALPLFAGKEVKIFPHIDPDGQRAGRRWATQLQPFGVRVNGYSFDGLSLPNRTGVNDLNDFAKILSDDPAPEELHCHVALLREAISFGPGVTNHQPTA